MGPCGGRGKKGRSCPKAQHSTDNSSSKKAEREKMNSRKERPRFNDLHKPCYFSYGRM